MKFSGKPTLDQAPHGAKPGQRLPPSMYDMRMAYPIEKHGKRIVIREWRIDELEGMHRWLSDPVVNQFLSWGTQTLAESQSHLQETIESQGQEPREKYYLAIELIDSPGKTVGDTGFTWIDNRTAEIGYFLEPDFWGQGYATEAACLVIDLAFELRAELVIATCSAQNTASEKLMKRCGMRARESDNLARLVYGIESHN